MLVVGAHRDQRCFRSSRCRGRTPSFPPRINRDRAEAERLTREAARIRRGINQDELQLVVDAAREANSLIDQRTFSWTAFFNHIEATLPPDVMLTAVQPAFRGGHDASAMTVVGRRAADVDEFMEKLEATGAFEKVLPLAEDTEPEDAHGGAMPDYVALPDEPRAGGARSTNAGARQPLPAAKGASR